jgi:formamidopyrimidine-DNA glycosylase
LRMPELPEVESVCVGLSKEFLTPVKITNVEINNRKLRKTIARNVESALSGQTFHVFRRRAKYILMDTEKFTVISHLGMSGSWRFENRKNYTEATKRKHDHIVLQLENGNLMIYHDPRRFGIFEITEVGREIESSWLKHLGPEPLSDDFTGKYLKQKAKNKSVNVKVFLMDQKTVVGIGNIYASEILFMANVSPKKVVSRLKQDDWDRIVLHSKSVLETSIRNGGTTLRDYVKSDGTIGDNQNHLFVYDRAGQPCKKCGSVIRHAVIAARATYWCPKCQ